LSAALDGFGIGKRSRGLCQLTLGLVERGLKRARVNLEEQLAFLDERTFLIALPNQFELRFLRSASTTGLRASARMPYQRLTPAFTSRMAMLLAR
jgi:hypothetical protein